MVVAALHHHAASRGSHPQSPAASGYLRYTRRRMLLTPTVASLAAAAAACARPGGRGPAETPAGAGAAPRTPVTLRFAVTQDRLDSGLQEVIDAFNTRGTPIRVEPEIPAGALVDRVLVQATAGETPDLAHTHPRDYHPWVNAGILLGLDALMKQDKQTVPDILPAALQYWYRDGQYWAMPHNLSIQNIYFNKDLFDKHGLKTPDRWEQEGQWTFEVYLDLARRLTSGSGENKIFGAVWRHTALDIQLGFVWPFGGDLWDKDGKQTVLDRPEAIEAIQFQADLTAKYGVSPTDTEWQQFASMRSPTWGAAFGQGRCALEIQPNDSLAPHVIPAPFPKGMVPMPKGRAGRIIRGLAVGVHILKDSKNRDAAWEFALFQSGKESEQIMLRAHVSLPWRKSTLATMDQSLFLPWERADFYAEGVRHLRATPYVTRFAEINRLYNDGYIAVRNGQKSAAQMIAEIKPQINELLRG
jgi:multiple sugar transport system substrate-binding protein